MRLPAGFVAVDEWLERASGPLDPAAMQFRAVLAIKGAGECAGCIFRGQPSKVCKVAGILAVRADLPDCEDKDRATGRTHIYIRSVRDPRQMDLTED